ncbi:domain-containing 2-like isoform X3 [Octopus vulgaris]|uniref:Domain-containing 2-like isoform X3 n=1 Tax=Octopus vulgaris TaxID=6645 RepID=A0AA36BG70_OCTVU|nr:domain-containing 2-like isoform X3 [Octopus vulgaris]
MSEYRNSKQEFSLNGSDDSLISNELNNNFSIICPCYSNEDLISLGLDSPPPHKADLTFQSTVVAPREAAGESKSDLDDIDIDPFLDQQDNYRSEHNLNNFNINRTGFPISHHQKIKITNNSNDLLNFQSNNNQKKLASYNELLEDELESPFSTDGSLPSSFGAQAADEDGDINTHLSLMHSQNDGVEETLVMSPDSGRPDSPRIQKNSSLNSLTISHKRDIASPYSNISDDFKSEDDSSTVYYDVKTDEDDTTTYQDLSEISAELGDKFQKSNHSDFSESADSCKTSESSFDMCNDGDQETNRSSKPLKNTMMSGVHLKSRDTKSLPRTMTSSYMTESFQDNQLKSLNKYAIDTSLLKNVSEKILPSSNSSVNNKEKLVLPKRLFSSSMKQERKNSNKTRSEEKPFRVEVLKGILGLGMKLTVDENGFVRVSEIKSQSTIGKNGNIKVGDYILSINSTDLVNVTDSQVQQILRLLPRGLITVIASVLPITDWKSHFADSTFKSVPSSLPNSEISPVIFPSSPKLVSVNSSFSEKQPAIIHATKNDTQNSVASSPKRPTNWNSEASDKQTSSSPLTVTKKSDFAVEEDLCSRVVVTKDKHSIRNGRTSPRSLPLVDLSDFSTDNSKERTSSVLTSNMSHVAFEPIKDNHKKESYHSTEVSFDQFDSPSRSLATQSSNIKQIPDKNETKMEWSTNLPPTLDSMSPLIPTNSSLISISTESHVAPIELVQKEESVGSHSMPPSFSASKSKETETVSSQMVTPAVEQPISPRITSNRKLPDIFKSSRTNALVVGQITSPSASEILFTDFAPGSPNVSPVIESVIDVQKSKHNFAEVPKAEIATSEPIVMQPKVSKDLPQSPVETTSITSSQVTISKDDAVSQNKFQTPSTAKAETFPLKADQEIPEVEKRRASLKRETLESVTQVESSRKGTQKTNGDDFKDNLPSGEHKKLTVNIPTSPKKSEVIQNTNQSPQSTDSSSVMLRRSRGRSQGSPRSELISEKSLVFSPDSKVSESSSKQMSLQRRKELAKTCIEPHMVFTKRKWCISTRFGQTNFALPSEPESSQDVLKLSLLDEDTVIDFVSKANFALDKLGLSNHYSIHIGIVEKEASEKVGIRLQKGEKQELLISLLEPDGAAKRQQYIYEGDLLLYMNDKPAWNQTVMDMKTLLQTTATRIILLLARPFVGEDSETFEITLRKGVTGLGFSLGGGIGCPLGDRPISVKRIFKGGIADKCGEMRVGDEILEVNGEDFRNQRHFHAWNHLKFLPEGDLKLLICRHRNSEKVDPLPTRTRTARPGTASGETASATSTTTTVTTTTSVEPRDPPSVTPVLPLVQLSPEKASTGIAAAAAMIAISTVGAVKDPHQLQKSTTTTTTNTTITTTTTNTMQTQ